jgi:hypothetical protein
MKERYFKYTTLSFVLINIWTTFAIFKYFLIDPGPLALLNIGGFFILNILTANGIGILLILLRVSLYIKNKNNHFKNNFFYIFTGIFNLNLLVIWIVTIIYGILILNLDTLPYIIGNLLIATFVFIDIYLYKEKKKNNNEKNIPA